MLLICTAQVLLLLILLLMYSQRYALFTRHARVLSRCRMVLFLFYLAFITAGLAQVWSGQAMPHRSIAVHSFM